MQTYFLLRDDVGVVDAKSGVVDAVTSVLVEDVATSSGVSEAASMLCGISGVWISAGFEGVFVWVRYNTATVKMRIIVMTV